MKVGAAVGLERLVRSLDLDNYWAIRVVVVDDVAGLQARQARPVAAAPSIRSIGTRVHVASHEERAGAGNRVLGHRLLGAVDLTLQLRQLS